MACPTCDHTMHHIGISPKYMTFWCPRCGTLKNSWGPADGEFTFTKTKLAERVIEFCGTLTEDDQHIIDNLERLGVTEAATHPDVRL